ncbi:L-lactate permease [Amycolatopsis pithecellobii]|uniref:L-lactate permease n=1 Tax=Amycolatopsis pithecellobii TaxID=664692 RepID=A0A6N7Z2J5_9PSEU|nr:L-lactate permease [Amycolatopsis pithecellobii]MTD55149.1 L-lactate permease [Amycolatopsis pithecellobii]
MFTQILDPVHSVLGSTLLALVPVAVLLVVLAVVRLSAWQAVIIGAIVTLVEAIFIWHTPAKDAFTAYGLGAATGFWSINWIVFWGVIIYHTLVVTGAFDGFKRWLVSQATGDIRVQTILIAWAFGALMEGLVGFGYPWAVVAPLLIGFGIADLAAVRVAALANNAPVSYGALGAPVIGLAAVTSLPLLSLSAAIGKIVAVLALAPPWLLIYLVAGRRGFRTGWPLAIVGSFGYIAGQYPTSQWLGPYLPDIIGSLVCFGALLILLRFWRPSVQLGFGGRELTPTEMEVPRSAPGATRAPSSGAARGLIPFGILVAVVVAWTGPWSPLPNYIPFAPKISAISSLTGKTTSTTWSFAPFIAGTAILVSWLLIAAYLRPRREQLREVFSHTFRQTWGALLVGPLIFGLAQVFNFSGMANSMANGFSKVGTAFIVLAPILGWIAVALSGSNTSANAVFGQFQATVGRLLGAPVLLFPALNSVGSEVGKPVAPQTASVGVATTSLVRQEGHVIRHNMGWTLVILVYLIGIGALFYFLLPNSMQI